MVGRVGFVLRVRVEQDGIVANRILNARRVVDLEEEIILFLRVKINYNDGAKAGRGPVISVPPVLGDGHREADEGIRPLPIDGARRFRHRADLLVGWCLVSCGACIARPHATSHITKSTVSGLRNNGGQ